MALKPISSLPVASAVTGDELIEVSQLSTSVTITAITISALAADNSYNDSATGFVTAGFLAGDRVKVVGFTGDTANNIFIGTVGSVTAGKLVIDSPEGDVIVDDAAGESVTITKWTSRRTTATAVGALGGGGGGGGAFIGAMLAYAAATTQAMAASSYDLVEYDEIQYQVGATWTNLPTFKGRFIVPAGVAYVRLTAGLRDQSSVASQLIVSIYKNGTDAYAGASSQETDTTGGDACSVASPVLPVIAGDYFEVFMYSSSAGRIFEQDPGHYFSIEKVG
jgi:hypothetical protein